MVPGLAVEEFSTPPSSPVMTRTIRNATVPTTDSVDYKSVATTSKDLTNDKNDIIQLGEYNNIIEDNTNIAIIMMFN